MATERTAKNGCIEPDAGWHLQSEHGFMRCADGPSGRLVRLYDIALWLMSSREIPLAQAVKVIGDAIEVGGTVGLHWLRDNDYAEAMDAPSPWDEFVANDAKSVAQSLCAAWLKPPHELERLVNAPGYDVVYDASKESPFEFANRPNDPSGRYAITLERAHAYWGWGRVAEVVQLRAVPGIDTEPTSWSALVEFRKKHAQSEWTLAQKALLVNEFKTRQNVPGASGVAKSMAGELGITQTRFNDLKRTATVSGKRQAARTSSA